MYLAHKLVLDALIAGDEDAADAELRRHIRIPEGYEALIENGKRRHAKLRPDD